MERLFVVTIELSPWFSAAVLFRTSNSESTCKTRAQFICLLPSLRWHLLPSTHLQCVLLAIMIIGKQGSYEWGRIIGRESDCWDLLSADFNLLALLLAAHGEPGNGAHERLQQKRWQLLHGQFQVQRQSFFLLSDQDSICPWWRFALGGWFYLRRRRRGQLQSVLVRL